MSRSLQWSLSLNIVQIDNVKSIDLYTLMTIDLNVVHMIFLLIFCILASKG